MVIPGLPEKDFWKKVQKSGNDFKNSGNIPDVADFLQKGWTVADFLRMYCLATFFWVNLNDFGNSGNIPDVEKFFEKSVSDFRFFAYVLYVNRRNFWNGYPWKKSRFFLISWKKLRPLGKKLNRSKKFSFSSKMVRQKRDVRERNWVDAKKIEIFSKIVRLKRLVRERN